jgi:cyclic beta-1,2-glucan synthetase
MTKRIHLISYYLTLQDAREALRQLRANGFRHTALLYRSTTGKIRTESITRQGWRWRGGIGGLILGILLGWLTLTLASFPSVLGSALILLGCALVGALAGCLFIQLTSPGIDSTLLARHARWLVTGEAAVEVLAAPASLARAIPMLRQIGEIQPSIFIQYPRHEDTFDDEPLHNVPLTHPQLQRHAQSLAKDHQVEISTKRDEPLLRTLEQAGEVIDRIAKDLSESRNLELGLSPSAEWLLDNNYIVQGHIRDVRLNLSKRFYHELPTITKEQHRGEPRIYKIAEELILHTDNYVVPDNIGIFLDAYQTISTLSIAELWAMPLMLRIALIDILHRLALEVGHRFQERELADFWSNRLLVTARREPSRLFDVLAELARENPDPSPYFAFQLIGYLYDEQAALLPVQSWLVRQLHSELSEINLQEQRRQAAIQISIGNAITSLRQLSLLDWREIFERHSRVEEILRNDPAGVYEAMDFKTRDRYRKAVEEIAQGARKSEVDVAKAVVSSALEHSSDRRDDNAHLHVGYYLIDEGRERFVQQLGGRESLSTRTLGWVYQHHSLVYLSMIGGVSAVLAAIPIGLGIWTAGLSWLVFIVGLLAVLPASELAVQAVNYILTRFLPPRTLPKLSFQKSGIPDVYRTLVVVPMILTDRQTIVEELEKLEIRYLANPHPNLLYGLFADLLDADTQETDSDAALISCVKQGIEELNNRHGGNRFYLFLRPREWCESETKFIGWERKRGKLEELNRLLNALPPRSGHEIVYAGDEEALAGVRYVITLDSDTQLTRDTACGMIETIAHPLNQPRFEPDGKLPIGGYTIIQPRVSTALPSATATPFSRLFTDPVGSDPYTTAVSDVYQDLTGEGSYHGKGIYDPRAFYRSLAGRFPEQTLLSHDLIEGVHARVGLASDIELFDQFPADYISYSNRQHRWTRGDWQITDWLLPRVPLADWQRVANPLSIMNRWKIFDNLRRSLVPAALNLFLLVSWLLSPTIGAIASVLGGLQILFHALTQPLTWATSRADLGSLSFKDIGRNLLRSLAETALLPYRASLALDAITRVWYRRLISHRGLLQWTTVRMAESKAVRQGTMMLIQMAVVSVIAVGLTLSIWWIQPMSLYAALPFLALWFISPLLAWRLSVPARALPQKEQLSTDQQQRVRRLARKTWRYFDDFVSAETHWLPPDNYQVSHQNQLAMRTSPTNIGLWMLSAVAAYDFGYLTGDQVLTRIYQTCDTLDKLERFEGHLLNWYDIQSLLPLEPRYVSSVDSGNLLASLWTLEAGLRELVNKPLIKPHALHGLEDTLGVLRGILKEAPRIQKRSPSLDEISRLTQDSPVHTSDLLGRIRQIAEAADSLVHEFHQEGEQYGEAVNWANKLQAQATAWLNILDRYLPWVEILAEVDEEDLMPFGRDVRIAARRSLITAPSLMVLAHGEVDAYEKLSAARNELEAHDPLAQTLDHFIQSFDTAKWFAGEMLAKYDNIIREIRALSDGMNMRFLYDSERRLFSIGYNVSHQQLDNSFYDLLASEARLGSFVAIAKGEVPNEHWLSLHRPFSTVGRRSVLLSWTGTMFEYLMPTLFQRPFENSLLDEATQEAVALQIEYGLRHSVPWGISESAYGDLDLNKTYQYRAFGVPGLGLKRGLEEDLVIAPYATMLSLIIDPGESIRNLNRLSHLGMESTYGFYEAIDFRRQREREGMRGVIIRAFMAHHQAMGFLAMDNLLFGHAMQRRFHSDARVQAAEPLLYERIPVAPPLFHISSRELPVSSVAAREIAPSVSTFDTPHTRMPRTQLLGNGSYSLMVTNAGGGYSRWDDRDLTRWRADTTRDHWGTFCYIHDLENDHTWSNTYHPTGVDADRYSVNFTIDRAEFRRRDGNIETETDVFVSPEDDAEIRRITLINHSRRTRRLEVTSYTELALAPHNTDRQHPAFNKLFIETEAVEWLGALLAYRRPRDEDDPPIFAAHSLIFDGDSPNGMQFETDRRRFLGRGRTTAAPLALQQDLTNSAGYVLDPIFSLRQPVTLKPGQRMSISLILCASNTREGALTIMEKYRDPNAIDRALELSWAHAQLQLRLMRIQPDDARRFQQLARHMLYPNLKLRATFDRMKKNRLGQASLWPLGISGDLPIATVTINNTGDLGLVQQILKAHTYWRLHGLKSDLVILNEEASGYEQPLHEQLERMIEAHSMYTEVDQPGGVFLRTVDQIPEDELTLILAASHVALVAARGPLSQQLSTPHDEAYLPEKLAPKRVSEEPSSPLPFMNLPYFNSLGGFTEDGREYAIYLGPGDQTPAPWVNVFANPSFGAMVSESGSGFTWYGNSQQNRLTGWSNDPVSDPPSEAIYIRDEESGKFWSPTSLPVRERDAYRTRHGAGYSVCEHNSHAIEQELITFVPMDKQGGEPLRIQRLRLHNSSSRTRRLSVTFYSEWVLGSDHEDMQMHTVTRWDKEAQAILATNGYHPDYSERIAFAAISPSSTDFTADRASFLGRNRSLTNPDAMQRVNLAGYIGAGFDPCAALRVELELRPGQQGEVIMLLGQGSTLEEVHHLIQKYREPLIVEDTLHRTSGWWDGVLESVQVHTPEPSINFLLNRWLLYQTLSCRIWGRSGFYQSGGAIGFRDQLQDVMALIHADSTLAREHILLAASRQFEEGDVQHWWHPQSGAGIRSRISDDLLWLPYAVVQYVRRTADVNLLKAEVPFLKAPELEDDQHEIYLIPEISSEIGTLYEHCRRAIERGLTTGPHGLPLIGIGDWNDGMNRVGVEGVGESVWLAWFLVDVMSGFAELADLLGEGEHAKNYRQRAALLAATVEERAWDGEWYQRATFDDGTPLGSATSDEANIDSLPQSWAVISGAADEERAAVALESAWDHLVLEEDRLVLLFSPPFDKTSKNPGYIKGYPPGVRENGGQYTHGALWLAMAMARRKDGERATQLLRLLNPVEHAREPEAVWRYQVEPYVIAADVYRLPGRVGMGGWTWYTGSAGWMYRIWIEEVLGLKLQGDRLTIDPVIPSGWTDFSVCYRFGEAVYEINVENPDGVEHGVRWVELNGRKLEEQVISLDRSALKHSVRVRMGKIP